MGLVSDAIDGTYFSFLILLGVPEIQWLLFWNSLFNVATYFLLRPSYQCLKWSGIGEGRILRRVTYVGTWLVTLAAILVWYEMGDEAALFYLLVPFLIKLSIEVLDTAFDHPHARTMESAMAPVAAISFSMLGWQLCNW